MSISRLSCGDLVGFLKNGTRLDVYTSDPIPDVDQPARLTPDNTTASGSFKDKRNTLQIHRGQAAVIITDVLIDEDYDSDVEPWIEKELDIPFFEGERLGVGGKIKLQIGSDIAAPSLALDVLKTISKADRAVAVLDKKIYPLRPPKRTRESSPSDQQPSKHLHVDTTEK